MQSEVKVAVLRPRCFCLLPVNHSDKGFEQVHCAQLSDGSNWVWGKSGDPEQSWPWPNPWGAGEGYRRPAKDGTMSSSLVVSKWLFLEINLLWLTLCVHLPGIINKIPHVEPEPLGTKRAMSLHPSPEVSAGGNLASQKDYQYSHSVCPSFHSGSHI